MRVATIEIATIGPITAYTSKDPEDIAVELESQAFSCIGDVVVRSDSVVSVKFSKPSVIDRPSQNDVQKVYQ